MGKVLQLQRGTEKCRRVCVLRRSVVLGMHDVLAAQPLQSLWGFALRQQLQTCQGDRGNDFPKALFLVTRIKHPTEAVEPAEEGRRAGSPAEATGRNQATLSKWLWDNVAP